MKNGPREDVFPIKTGDIPASYVSLPEGKHHVEPLVCFCPALAMALKTVDLRWLGFPSSTDGFGRRLEIERDFSNKSD